MYLKRLRDFLTILVRYGLFGVGMRRCNVLLFDVTACYEGGLLDCLRGIICPAPLDRSSFCYLNTNLLVDNEYCLREPF